MATATTEYSPGLQGVIAGETAISKIVSETSTLTYRGINVHELAENASFEETAFLLLHGQLPDNSELDAFRGRLNEYRSQIPKQVIDTLRNVSGDAHPMDQIRAALDVAAGYDPDYADDSHDANVRKAERILAITPVLVASGYRIREGKVPVESDPNLGHAADFLYMLFGEKPDEQTTEVMDASLTLYAEHTFNASAFAARVTVSTLSDIYSGIVTGIGTLKGPLHGGANEKAMEMLLEIGSPENAEGYLREKLENKDKVMGFGHREYKKADSRAGYMTAIAKELGRSKGETKWGEIADVLEGIMINEKGIHPNVDFPAAYAYYLLGIPIELYTPIFVVARVSGWSAHVIEQLDNNRLIRPTCIYNGRENVPFVPLDER